MREKLNNTVSLWKAGASALLVVLCVSGTVRAQGPGGRLLTNGLPVNVGPVNITQIEKLFLTNDAVNGNNAAGILQSGNASQAFITQVNNTASANIATILQASGHSIASITQNGSSNQSVVVQNGSNNTAVTNITGIGNKTLIYQNGDGNSATQNISTSSKTYSIFQIGNNNSVAQTQSLPTSSPYIVTQMGSGLHIIIQNWTLPVAPGR